MAMDMDEIEFKGDGEHSTEYAETLTEAQDERIMLLEEQGYVNEDHPATAHGVWHLDGHYLTPTADGGWQEWYENAIE